MSNKVSLSSNKSVTRLIFLPALCLGLAFFQVSLGGFVRVSESGLGCPDWPLCYGKIIPPLEYHTMIEYSHRLSGSILGILIIILLITAYKSPIYDRFTKRMALVTFILVLFAGLLGGVVVVTELEWWIRLIHLSIAEVILACLVIIIWKIAYLSIGPIGINEILPTSWLIKLLVLTLIIFSILISGSWVVGIGATAACTTWPFCEWKTGYPYDIHMLHRYIAGISLIYLVYISLSLVTTYSNRFFIKKSVHSTLGLIGVQIILGAVMVWSEFTPTLKGIHLSVATLVWISTMFLVVSTFGMFTKKSQS